MIALHKLWAVARALLWQNRWLSLVMLLWPCAISVVLLFWSPGGRLQVDDVTAMLRQEAFYGIALVAVAASTQLGREERSRRVLEVLSRAFGRGEYLLSLALAAWLPLVAYVVSLLVNAALLAHQLAARTPALPWYALEQLASGWFAAGAGLLCAVLLSPALATVATFAIVGAITVLGGHGLAGPGRALGSLASVQLAGERGASAADLALAVAAGFLLMALAWICFRLRDLRLSE